MSGSLRVLSPGALSLVQDSGRQGFQRYGVSVSGAMDAEALFVGNLLVGNGQGAALRPFDRLRTPQVQDAALRQAQDAAAIEITFGGAVFVFENDVIAAITGADLGATLDGTPLPVWESFIAPAGSTLRFAAPVSGLRAYLACAGGIATAPVLSSRSTHTGSRLGGLDGGPLKAGDTLPLGEPSPDAVPGHRLPDALRPAYGSEVMARVIPGPQDDAFTDDGMETFYSSTYTVTEKSDRQGVRFDGPEIGAKNGRYDIVSDAVVFGSVQVPGDGMPIVLLADRQTTGGYAKIGVVATVDLPGLAQAAPGTAVRFEQITVQHAQQALRDRREKLLSADLAAGLVESTFALAVNGEWADLRLSYRPALLRSASGALVAARTGAGAVTVHAEELAGG